MSLQPMATDARSIASPLFNRHQPRLPKDCLDHCSGKGVRLAQNMQVGPCIPVLTCRRCGSAWLMALASPPPLPLLEGSIKARSATPRRGH